MANGNRESDISKQLPDQSLPFDWWVMSGANLFLVGCNGTSSISMIKFNFHGSSCLSRSESEIEIHSTNGLHS